LKLIKRFLRRLAVVCLGILTVWLIVFVILDDSERRLPWIVALGLTYAVAAYVILPRVVRMSLKILQRQSIPGFTITGDGMPGDPVNIVLVGTAEQLHNAFAATGWFTADPLGTASSWRMMRAFVLNASYPTAPFSSLFLFGRRQDVGFQEPIGDSPRKRHHVRFWALNLARSPDDFATASFWLNTDKPRTDEPVLWVGAATRDTGLSLTRITFQITHATDSDTSSERDYVVDRLRLSGVIGESTLHQSGDPLTKKRVNHYRTDGDIAFANLA
jgi:LssY C-terminus